MEEIRTWAATTRHSIPATKKRKRSPLRSQPVTMADLLGGGSTTIERGATSGAEEAGDESGSERGSGVGGGGGGDEVRWEWMVIPNHHSNGLVNRCLAWRWGLRMLRLPNSRDPLGRTSCRAALLGSFP